MFNNRIEVAVIRLPSSKHSDILRLPAVKYLAQILTAIKTQALTVHRVGSSLRVGHRLAAPRSH